jgi:hypothetical protein
VDIGSRPVHIVTSLKGARSVILYADCPCAPNQISRIYLGRHVYGLAAVIFGVITFAWRDSNSWQQIWAVKVTHLEILVCIAAALELFGGVAIQWPPARQIGALSLGGIYFVFALLSVPHIVASPLTYNNWGNFFEQFSLVSGALVVYGETSPNKHERVPRLARIGYICFGVCVVSFALEQLAYLFRNGKPRSKMDPSGTNVLGGNHDNCLCARRYRDPFLACRPSRISIAHGNAARLWAAGLAADCHLAPASIVQLD